MKSCRSCGWYERMPAANNNRLYKVYEVETVVTLGAKKEWMRSFEDRWAEFDKEAALLEGGKPIIDEVCEKCGHDKCYFESKQIRSADEGATIYNTCVRCAHVMTLNS